MAAPSYRWTWLFEERPCLFCHIIIGLLFVVVVLYNMALLRTYQYDGGVVARRLTMEEE